jgi:hypothetical protein
MIGFLAGREQSRQPLRLVLMGTLAIELPRHLGLLALGFRAWPSPARRFLRGHWTARGTGSTTLGGPGPLRPPASDTGAGLARLLASEGLRTRLGGRACLPDGRYRSPAVIEQHRAFLDRALP